MQAECQELERVIRICGEEFGDEARGWKVTCEWNPCHYRPGEPPSQVLRAAGRVLLVLIHPEETLKLTDSELRQELRAAWDQEFAPVSGPAGKPPDWPLAADMPVPALRQKS